MYYRVERRYGALSSKSLCYYVKVMRSGFSMELHDDSNKLLASA